MLKFRDRQLKAIIIVLLLLIGSIAYSQPLTDHNRVRFYEENKNVRCSGRIVSPGMFQHEVLDRCGEPLRETYVEGEPFDAVWIYRVSRRVYYLGFIHERLERIRSTRCWKDNPDCE